MKKLCLILLIVTVNSYAEDVYRWVDKNGTIHYGDTARHAKSERISVKPGEHNEQLRTKSEHISMTPSEYKTYIASQKILAARERDRNNLKKKGKGRNKNKGKSKNKNQVNKIKQSKSDDYLDIPAHVKGKSSQSKINLTSCAGINKAIQQNNQDLKSSDSDVYRTAKSLRKSHKRLLVKYNC